VPISSVGAKLSGGFDAGPTKLNWALYASNGPRVNTGDDEPDEVGLLHFDNFTDNNQNKAFGGRLGFLPIPELELGGSVQVSRSGANGTQFHKVDAVLFDIDLNFTKQFSALMGTVDIRAEWTWSYIDDTTFDVEFDELVGPEPVIFNNNKRNGGYIQFAYRPTMFEQKWVKNLEAVFRYDRIDNPHAPHPELVGEHQFLDRDRWAVGLNYWLGTSTVLKFAFEDDNRGDDSILMQFGMGF